MKNARELLDVIAASSLPVTDRLEQHRRQIVARVDEHLQRSQKDCGDTADALAQLLVEEGVVETDQDSVRDVVAEYLRVVVEEQAALGEEEMDFLTKYLK